MTGAIQENAICRHCGRDYTDFVGMPDVQIGGPCPEDDCPSNALWIVSGRVHGDDDDTVLCVRVQPGQTAQELFEFEILSEEPDLDDQDPPQVYINLCCPLDEFTADPVRRTASAE